MNGKKVDIPDRIPMNGSGVFQVVRQEDCKVVALNPLTGEVQKYVIATLLRGGAQAGPTGYSIFAPLGEGPTIRLNHDRLATLPNTDDIFLLGLIKSDTNGHHTANWSRKLANMADLLPPAPVRSTGTIVGIDVNGNVFINDNGTRRFAFRQEVAPGVALAINTRVSFVPGRNAKGYTAGDVRPA